jgi:hypothetical protein
MQHSILDQLRPRQRGASVRDRSHHSLSPGRLNYPDKSREKLNLNFTEMNLNATNAEASLLATSGLAWRFLKVLS